MTFTFRQSLISISKSTYPNNLTFRNLMGAAVSVSHEVSRGFNEEEFQTAIQELNCEFFFSDQCLAEMPQYNMDKNFQIFNFDRFEDMSGMDIYSTTNDNNFLVRPILLEYKRALATMHPLLIHQHIFQYLLSDLLCFESNERQRLEEMAKEYNNVFGVIKALFYDNAVHKTIMDYKCKDETIEVNLCGRLANIHHLVYLNNSLPSRLSERLRSSDPVTLMVLKEFMGTYMSYKYRFHPLERSTKQLILNFVTSIEASREPLPPRNPSVSPDAVCGVSLRFLTEFLDRHSTSIAEDTTTGQVVKDIVIPETSATRETYVAARLLDRPVLVSDLRKPYRKVKQAEYRQPIGPHTVTRPGFCCFLSHAWAMPFRALVRIAQLAASLNFESQSDAHDRLAEDLTCVGDISFFWIDVFCKNQHLPAPAAEEFLKALTAPGQAVVALHPFKPLVLERIWCLFEIWSSAVNDVRLLPTMSPEYYHDISLRSRERFASRADLRAAPALAEREKYLREREEVTQRFKLEFIEEMKTHFHVEVEKSTATFPEDVEMILSLIRQSVGVEEMNTIIFKSLCENLWVKVRDDCGYKDVFLPFVCFDGDGQVAMWDGSFKAVRDVREGDCVRTLEGEKAEVVLVAKTRVSAEDEGGVDVCEVQGVFLTPEHPVMCVDGIWRMPRSFARVKRLPIEFIYNFELSAGMGSCLINGLAVMTLGQEIGFEPRSDALFGWGWRGNPARALFLPIEAQ